MLRLIGLCYTVHIQRHQLQYSIKYNIKPLRNGTRNVIIHFIYNNNTMLKRKMTFISINYEYLAIKRVENINIYIYINYIKHTKNMKKLKYKNRNLI